MATHTLSDHVFRLHRPARAVTPRQPRAERPLWLIVAVLYAVLVVIVALVITLTFLVADLVTGQAY